MCIRLSLLKWRYFIFSLLVTLMFDYISIWVRWRRLEAGEQACLCTYPEVVYLLIDFITQAFSKYPPQTRQHKNWKSQGHIPNCLLNILQTLFFNRSQTQLPKISNSQPKPLFLVPASVNLSSVHRVTQFFLNAWNYLWFLVHYPTYQIPMLNNETWRYFCWERLNFYTFFKIPPCLPLLYTLRGNAALRSKVSSLDMNVDSMSGWPKPWKLCACHAVVFPNTRCYL